MMGFSQVGRSCSPLPACVVGSCIIGAACSPSPIRSCATLFEEASFAEAAAQCEEVYESSGDGRAAVFAARAERELGHEKILSKWEWNLRGTPEEAEVLELSAKLFLEKGEPEQAAERYRRLVGLSAATGDHSRAARAHSELFYIAWGDSSYREALAHAARAYEAARSARSRELEVEALYGLFVVLYETGDLLSALECLRLAGELVPEDDRRTRASLALNEGAVLMDQKRYSLARAALDRAIDQRSGEESNVFLRSVYLNHVNIDLTLGDVSAAAKNLAQAARFVDPGQTHVSLLYYQARLQAERGELESAMTSLTEALDAEPEPEWRWRIETEVGRMEERLGRHEPAARAYASAIETIEEMRGTLALDDLKSWLLEQKRAPYEALFRLRALGERPLAALEVVERAKARTFLDAFVHGTLPSSAEVPLPPFAPLERFDAIDRLLPSVASSPVASLRPLAEVLRDLGERQVLVYFLAEDRLWLARVGPEDVRIGKLDVPLRQLQEGVNGFLGAPDSLKLATELGRALLPRDSLPPRGTPLYVVPDAFVGKVPFAALRIDGRYLVEDHVISTIPSLNAMAALLRRSPSGDVPAVVLASAETELPGAAAEARSVAASLGVAPRIGAKATFAELRRAAGASLLHLAVHTGVDRRGPWIDLADETVTSETIWREKIGPSVVVLASCASASRAGKDLWGSLGATFLAAGSRSVVASLRSIPDEPTHSFVQRFYENEGSRKPALALALTQRSFLREGVALSFWSPFVHLGLAEPLSRKETSNDQHQ